MTCLIQSTALKDLTLLPLLPGYLLEQGEGLKVKGKASVQSDMKLHSKRSVDKKPRPISKSSLWSFQSINNGRKDRAYSIAAGL